MPICIKLWEKLMFKSSFNFTDTRNIPSAHESVFPTADSGAHKLILIVYEVYAEFSLKHRK